VGGPTGIAKDESDWQYRWEAGNCFPTGIILRRDRALADTRKKEAIYWLISHVSLTYTLQER